MTQSLTLAAHLRESAAIIARVAEMPAAAQAERAAGAIAGALRAGKPLLVCGNGGSASDAMHITGELVGRFLKERKGYRCICLASNGAVMTSLSNDYGYDTVFARQVEAYGETGGVLWGLSTSGNSPNVVAAFDKARALGMTTLAMTGEGGGKLAALADILVDAPSRHTPYIQQAHLCLYHYICEAVERELTAA